MQKKTRSLLEELESIGNNKDVNLLIENRANNVISSAINLLELMKKHQTLLHWLEKLQLLLVDHKEK